MNALSERIARLIRFSGPISIAQYMAMALHDPACGYYATQDVIGAGGDFTTAPEISQMFGELLGAWMVRAWRAQNCPSPSRLVELGPGRGTLLADVLRTARQDTNFLAAHEIVLVEASARLRERQAALLEGAGAVNIRWCDSFDEGLCDRPLFLLANEFFDALPMRQFAYNERGWCERMVGTSDSGALRLALSPSPVPLRIPEHRGTPQPGSVYEVCPGGEAVVQQIASVIAQHGGAALIVDYGYGAEPGFGDTLQAVAQHRFADVLENPGEADLSAHVDFAALAKAAVDSGAVAFGPVAQGTLLMALGIEKRAERLMREAPANAADVAAALDRLVSGEQMGKLFKALAILPPGASAPAGF